MTGRLAARTRSGLRVLLLNLLIELAEVGSHLELLLLPRRQAIPLALDLSGVCAELGVAECGGRADSVRGGLLDSTLDAASPRIQPTNDCDHGGSPFRRPGCAAAAWHPAVCVAVRYGAGAPA